MNIRSFELKKIIILLVSVGFVLVLSFGAYIAFENNTSNSKATPSQQIITPPYATILPSNSTIESLGGWKKVSPPEAEPVYAYSHTIDSVDITVSEQPLPESFKTDIDSQLADLAKKFNANDQLETPNATAYIGTSANGPQSVIMTKNKLLILMKSQKKIEDSSWVRYINSLN
jgi:hypothetical protein